MLFTPEACAHLIAALTDIEAQARSNPVALAQTAIGPELRFDHCVALNRAGGDRGIGWHSHDYAEERPESPLRWCVVYAYRNPGAPLSAARWITPEFEKNPPSGAAWLMPEQ